jgi:hypothetical protein
VAIPIKEEIKCDHSEAIRLMNKLINLIELRPESERELINSLHHINTHIAWSQDYPKVDISLKETIEKFTEIKLGVDSKISKAISKICMHYGVDTDSRISNEYKKITVPLFDLLSPKIVEMTFVLSVHPCDYLEMSNKSNSWSSCHSLDSSYQAGTLSYMCDSVSMVAYTVSDTSVTKDFYKLPKVNRQMYMFDGVGLVQSRLYPNHTQVEKSKMYCDIVKKILSDERFILAKNKKHILTSEGAKHYEDYNRLSANKIKFNINFHRIRNKELPIMKIGSPGNCIVCGGTFYGCGNLVCNDCREKFFCKFCLTHHKTPLTRVYRRNGTYRYACNDCLDGTHVCKKCGKHINYKRIGTDKEVYCNECFDEMFYSCNNCGRTIEYGITTCDGGCKEPEFISFEEFRKKYREGWVLCKTRQQADYLMKYLDENGVVVFANILNIMSRSSFYENVTGIVGTLYMVTSQKYLRYNPLYRWSNEYIYTDINEIYIN